MQASVLNCMPAYKVKKHEYHVRLKVVKSRSNAHSKAILLYSDRPTGHLLRSIANT